MKKMLVEGPVERERKIFRLPEEVRLVLVNGRKFNRAVGRGKP